MAKGVNVKDIRDVPGTVMNLSRAEGEEWLSRTSAPLLPSYEELLRDKDYYLKMGLTLAKYEGWFLGQWHADRLIAQNPSMPYSQEDLDWLFSLPWTKEPHPHYKGVKIPAWETVKDSIILSRGCPASCTFCSIRSTQGRIVVSRSKESILREVEELVKKRWFRGTISDIGGPTANISDVACSVNWGCLRSALRGSGVIPKCLEAKPCPRLDFKKSHEKYLSILRAVRGVKGVRNVFVSSGLRYDLLLRDPEFLETLIRENFIGGHLSVAPEHVSNKVLRLMGKPPHEVFEAFRKLFNRLKDKYRKEIYLIPYFISSFPGATLEDAKLLGDYVREVFGKVEQIQDFIPIPLTLATVMYYTEKDLIGNPIHVAKSKRERFLQRQLVQPWIGKGRRTKEKGERKRERRESHA